MKDEIGEAVDIQEKLQKNSMKITVIKDGPYLVSGKVPLIASEINHDDEGQCRGWRKIEKFPLKERYALCRCGSSENRPFCDGTHTKIHFDGTESGDHDSFSDNANIISGPVLTLYDNKHFCVHAEFCVRAGGIWKLVRQSDSQEARNNAVEEAWDCPSGRLVILDNATKKKIEPEFEKSIVVVEYPFRDEQGPLWVRGGIPIVSAEGKMYEIRNRVTLCRCGKSRNKPFCDGSHFER